MVQIGHYYHNTFLAHLTCIMLAKQIIRKIGKKNKFKNKKPIQLYSTSSDTAESAALTQENSNIFELSNATDNLFVLYDKKVPLSTYRNCLQRFSN